MIIDKNNFEQEVLKSEKPVLIDFWAPWCGPCRAISPIVDEIAKEISELKVCKINVDENPELASKYGVMSIPLLVVIQNGEMAAESLGVRPKAEIMEFLKPYIKVGA